MKVKCGHVGSSTGNLLNHLETHQIFSNNNKKVSHYFIYILLLTVNVNYDQNLFLGTNTKYSATSSKYSKTNRQCDESMLKWMLISF